MTKSSEAVSYWEVLTPRLMCARDSCNVYAVVGAQTVVIVNAGTAAWLDQIEQLPAPVGAVLCTHTGPGHAEGARRITACGIPLYVPEGERLLLTNRRDVGFEGELYEATEAFRFEFAPVDQLPDVRSMLDYETLTIDGLAFDVLPAPGIRLHQVALGLELPEVGQVIFSGETIHAPDRVPRLAPLQQSYLDLGGLPMIYWSAEELRRRHPRLLLPSYGDAISDADRSLRSLRVKLRRFAEKRFGGPIDQVETWSQFLDVLDGPDIEQIGPRIYCSGKAFGVSTFVVGDSGKVLAFDYGFSLAAFNWYVPGTPHTRRYLLHSLDGLADATGQSTIDVCIPTHYHDDHVGGIPLLQRLHGTQAWVCTTFADVVERPWEFNLAAQSPSPLRVDRRFEPGDTLSWDGIDISVSPPFSGHTALCSGFGLELDGVKYAIVGDQYLSRLLWIPQPDHSWDDDEFDDVYSPLNRYALDGYRRSEEWLTQFSPDVILNGHQRPIRVTETVRRRVSEYTARFEELHLMMAPLGDDDVHFGPDGIGAELRPYRSLCQPGAMLELTATVRNPLPHDARLDVTLRGPDGWLAQTASARAAGHAAVRVLVRIIAPDEPSDRQPIALDLVANDRPFGQVAQAIVTVGGKEF